MNESKSLGSIFIFAKKRRGNIIQSMQDNENAGKDCSKCSGVCCTFVANSMQITPIEALEILVYLENEKRLNRALVENLLRTVKKYRLDYDVGTGKTSIRKTYTCPFFQDQSLGCSLKISTKPYGCLAFNPNIVGQTEGGDCSSMMRELKDREENWEKVEEKINSTLISELSLLWKKAPIPIALLDFINFIGLSELEDSIINNPFKNLALNLKY